MSYKKMKHGGAVSPSSFLHARGIGILGSGGYRGGGGVLINYIILAVIPQAEGGGGGVFN